MRYLLAVLIVLCYHFDTLAQNRPNTQTASWEYETGMYWYARETWSSATPHLYRAILLLESTDRELADSCLVNCIRASYNQVNGFDYGYRAYKILLARRGVVTSELTAMALANYLRHGCAKYLADSTLLIQSANTLVSLDPAWNGLKADIYDCIANSDTPWPEYTSHYYFDLSRRAAALSAQSPYWKNLLPKVRNKQGLSY